MMMNQNLGTCNPETGTEMFLFFFYSTVQNVKYVKYDLLSSHSPTHYSVSKLISILYYGNKEGTSKKKQ